jgi:hypothetical protein
MRNAKTFLACAAALVALAACHGNQQAVENNGISMDVGAPSSQGAADNAQIEALPADESSVTPSNQLQNGFDNPDVNAVGTGNSQ